MNESLEYQSFVNNLGLILNFKKIEAFHFSLNIFIYFIHKKIDKFYF